MHDLGLKIAKEYAQSLYEIYLTREFKIDRSNLLTMFAKRMVNTFAGHVAAPNIADKVNVPLLIDLLENKEFLGEKYKILTKNVL